MAQPKKQQTPNNLEFYTPEEVARLFKVKETTVRLWLRRKLMKGVKAGHSWRISRQAIEEFSS